MPGVLIEAGFASLPGRDDGGTGRSRRRRGRHHRSDRRRSTTCAGLVDASCRLVADRDAHSDGFGRPAAVRGPVQPREERRAVARASRRSRRRRVHVLYLIDSLISGGAEQSLAVLAPHYTCRWRRPRRCVSLRTRQRPDPGVGSRRGPRVFGCRNGRHRWRDALHPAVADRAPSRRAAHDALRRRHRRPRRRAVHADTGRDESGERIVWRGAARQPRHSCLEVAGRVARRCCDGAACAAISRGVDERRVGLGKDDCAFGRTESTSSRAAAIRRISANAHRRGPSTARHAGRGDDDQVVLAVGRHEYQKGFDVLIAGVRATAPPPAPRSFCSSWVATAT